MTKTIVVIDDSLEFLSFMTDLLTGEDYHVVTHPDPNTALEILRREQPHLLIVDIAMPGKTGWTVIDEIRSDHDIADTPIIVCTAAVTEVAKRQQYEDELRVQIIAKPFGVDQLLTLIEGSIARTVLSAED